MKTMTKSEFDMAMIAVREGIGKDFVAAGFTEIIVGIIMVLTGASDWYFETFHFFGIMGMCLIFYAYWNLSFVEIFYHELYQIFLKLLVLEVLA